MKKTKKILAMLLCAVLLVTGTVAVTVAYLTDDDVVTNTFTVGNVNIKLDEAPVDENGDEISGDRVQENSYHLLPGHKYDKDPMVTVEAESEDCYLFVKVENGLADLGLEAATAESGYQNIEAQMTANGWVKTSKDNIWVYATVDSTTNVTNATVVSAEEEKVVFEYFKIADSVTNIDLETVSIETEENPTVIKITAYAIQKDGFAATEIDKMLTALGL